MQVFCLKSQTLTLCLYNHFISMVALLLLQPHILTVLSFIAQIRTIIKDFSGGPVVDSASTAWAMVWSLVGELRFCILCKSQNQDYLQIICNMNYAKIKCIYLMILGNFWDRIWSNNEKESLVITVIWEILALAVLCKRNGAMKLILWS